MGNWIQHRIDDALWSPYDPSISANLGIWIGAINAVARQAITNCTKANQKRLVYKGLNLSVANFKILKRKSESQKDKSLTFPGVFLACNDKLSASSSLDGFNSIKCLC